MMLLASTHHTARMKPVSLVSVANLRSIGHKPCPRTVRDSQTIGIALPFGRAFILVPKMEQWLFTHLTPFEVHLIAIPSIMLGAILLCGGIILLLEAPRRDDR